MKLYTVKREKSFLSPLSYLFFSKKTCLFKPLFQSFLYNSEHLKIQADSYPMPTVHSCSIYGYFPPAAALAATAYLLFHTRFQPPQIRLPETILPLPAAHPPQSSVLRAVFQSLLMNQIMVQELICAIFL